MNPAFAFRVIKATAEEKVYGVNTPDGNTSENARVPGRTHFIHTFQPFSGLLSKRTRGAPAGLQSTVSGVQALGARAVSPGLCHPFFTYTTSCLGL